MKRILTIICAIAFSSATLLAQNDSDIIKDGRNEYQLGFWGHLDGKHMHNVKLGVAYTF